MSTDDDILMPGEQKEDKTFAWGDHSRVVKRPPQGDISDRPNADPTQNESVKRWECLDCGFIAQADCGLAMVFSSRDCPPDVIGEEGGSE